MLARLRIGVLSLGLAFVLHCTKKVEEPSGGVETKAADSPEKAAASEIVIGEIGSLTGSEATFGTSTRDGIALAVKELNAAGGVLGKQIRVVVYDDQGKSEEAATAMTKLITQDKVVAVLGEVASSRSLAMAPLAQKYKIPMLTPASTNPKVTEVGDYIFRSCFIDPFQGEVMAKFAFNSLKVKRVAVFRDVRNDYSVGLANYFNDTFTKLGGSIATDQSYSSGDIDFKSQLTKIRAQKPAAIFVPGYYTDVGLIARQARELGIKVPLLGGDGWDSAKLLEIGGAALNNGYFSNHYSIWDKSENVQKFAKTYQAEFKSEAPDAMAGLAYDAMYMLADAIKRAGNTDTTAIRNALAQTKNFLGVTGNTTINEKRDATKSAVVLGIKDGKYEYIETVQP